MKIQERVILICFLAGLGLGVVGILLKVLPTHHGTVSACTFQDSSTTPDCTPPHVVQYTLETQPQVASVAAGKQNLLAQATPFILTWPINGPLRLEASRTEAGSFKKLETIDLPASSLLPLTSASDRLDQPASRLPGREQSLLSLARTTSLIPLRAGLLGRGRVIQSNTASDRLWIRPDGTPAYLVEHAVITATILALLQPDEIKNHPHQHDEDATNFKQKATISEAPISWRSLIPAARPSTACPTTSSARFELIPIEGPPADHPDQFHGDLTLRLRGYQAATEQLALVDYNGPTDPDAPQLAGLFEANRMATLSSAYRVNHWLWDAGACNGQTTGCPGEAISDWPVTLLGLAAKTGEAIYVPERGAEIYGGGYVALVLYAEEKRITLGYTRRDSVAAGYVIHIEQVCVDPNLVALYRAQNDGAGWRSSGRLPALRNNQALGTALGHEILVAVRDNGNFLDPRSRKDWWQQ